MNWEALGAIAELLGAIGVILTLLYLSRQIDNNSKQLEGSAVVAIAEYERSMLEDIFDNEKLWDIIKRGNGDWDALNEEDQSMFAVWNIKESGYWELLYRLHRQGAVSKEIYSTKENYYLELYQTQGRRKWWDEHNTLLLGRDFVEQMTKKLNDNLTSPADFKAKHPFWEKS